MNVENEDQFVRYMEQLCEDGAFAGRMMMAANIETDEDMGWYQIWLELRNEWYDGKTFREAMERSGEGPARRQIRPFDVDPDLRK